MDQILLRESIFRLIIFTGDGIAWTLSVFWILTGLFGYPVKKSGKRFQVFFAVIIINTLLATGSYVYSKKNGLEVALSNEFLVLFCMIYWMFYLKEQKRIKRFFVICFAVELFTAIFNLVGCIFSLVTDAKISGHAAVAVTLLLQQGTILLAIGFFSRLSSKKRREPMRFNLIFATFILGVFLDCVLKFFQPEGYNYMNPVVTFRIIAPGVDLDKATAVGILSFITLAAVLFLVLTIRDSESVYFQQKNTVSEYYLEAQKVHYESLMQSNREIRKLKHDMKNHIYCLKELCQKQRYGELERYLSEIAEGFARAEVSVQVGNEIADAILSEKMKKAAEKQITLTIEGNMIGVDLKAIDTCTIFANILDNAIEAVELLPETQRKIHVSLRKNRNYFLITESNKTAQKQEIGEDGIATTKKDKGSHGFGIINIRDAVARYDGECVIAVAGDADEEGYYEFRIEVMIPMG